jgi:hypothetical protein
MEIALESLKNGIVDMKTAKRLLREVDPNAPRKSAIGMSQAEIDAFSRKMSEALAYLNGGAGGVSTANRLRNVIIAVEAQRSKL